MQSTNKTVDPVIVSIGHKISLKTALDLTMTCCKYRVPEPVIFF